ncbi:MAG: S26 family signal peptidase [Breznakibacter sp.]
MKDIPRKRWIKGAIAVIVYLLWVIWIGNYWLLLGLPIVFDIYVTKKVPWDFWKRTKDGKRPGCVVEWADALLFALGAVYLINLFFFQNYKIPTSSLEKSLLVGDYLFVSKLSYGPRMPNTPLAFPLVQNTFPVTNSKSYFEWPQWDYKRIKGFGNVKRDDIVVFNFPAGDTIAFLVQNPDYYNLTKDIGIAKAAQDPSLVSGRKFENAYSRNQFFMSLGKQEVAQRSNEFGEIMTRPVDRRENYVKRCVALPGDTFEIRHNQIFINGKAVENPKGIQHIYHIKTDGTLLSDNFFEKFGISNDDKREGGSAPHYYLPLTEEKAAQLRSIGTVKQLVMDEMQPDSLGMSVFPYSPDYPWSRDNFGPLCIPGKGVTVNIDAKNIVLYDRIITSYEGNKLQVKDNTVYINGTPATSYTFKMDYYFMMGDNRHKSADSRYWGFVPEDHVVGKPLLVWLSLDKDKSFPASVRWSRLFKWVANEQ